jgi:hypothetical protein
MDPAHVSREHKIEGSDWTAVFNPKVRRELNVELVQTLQHDSVVCCVRFSPDGTMLATGCNRYLHLYEAKTGRKLECVEPVQVDSTGGCIRAQLSGRQHEQPWQAGQLHPQRLLQPGRQVCCHRCRGPDRAGEYELVDRSVAR